MKLDWSHFRDPETGSPLVSSGDHLSSVDGAEYPIINDIPRFVPAENYATAFGEQWNRFPKTQLDSHTGTDMSEARLARCFGGDLGVLNGKLVLEAGSGAGRFTEILLKHGAILHSFDYSSAVEANRANNGSSDRLTLAQCDIRKIPFDKASYDYVVCLGVIQHTPSPEETIASLWAMVKPGGTLVIDHYRYRLRFLLPTPFGSAESVYRWVTLKLPARSRRKFVDAVTRFWFPIHWRFRNSLFAQRVIRRFSPVHFYYSVLPLRDKDAYFEWALLDTHDAQTDYYKHLRSPDQIRQRLEELGAIDIDVSIGGNGVEARATKPLTA